MVGEIIKSYLVSLGVEIDKPGFDQMKTTLDKTSGTVASATGSWAKNFVAAGTIIGTAVAGITAAIAGVMTAAAKQDLAMEKYARNMMVSKNAAMEMKTAIDALGESVQDIQLTPELMNRYQSLVGDGRQMKVGGDYEGTMKGFRDLIFEFTRLKQEASYALQWVGYYLMKYLSKPLSDAKVSFKSFNDSMIKNMPVWTEKVARALMYIINVGRHFWDLLKVIGKTITDVWDAFPRGVKIATAAVAGFFMLLRASPISRMVTLISTLLLMVDDYFGHAEGKNAALGTVWDKLNGYMETGKQKLQEWGNELVPMWDEFIGYLGEAKDGVIDFSDKCAEWFDEIQQSKALNDFLDVAKRLGKALSELGDGTIDLVTESCKNLFDSLEKQDSAKSFTELMQWLWDIFLGLVDAISEGTEIIAKWLEEMGRSEVVRDLIDASVELLNVIMDLISAIFDLCNEALGEFFKGMDKTEPVYTFRDAVKAVTEFITAMIRAVSSLIRWLRDLFGLVKNDKSFKEYWRAQGEAVQMFADIVFRALGAVGKLGKAVLALMSNKPGYAAKLAGEALDMLFGGGKAEASGKFSFGGDGPTGSLSALGESGNVEGDPGAYGRDSTGGHSFGAYQIAEKVMPSFLEFLQGRNAEYAKRLKSIGTIDEGKFLTEWKRIVTENPKGFKDLQHDFIKENHYDEAVNSISSRTGMDVNSMSRTMQEVVWSLAVQHGSGSGIRGAEDDGAARIFERAYEQLGSNANEEDFITLLYKLRKEYFSKSTPGERQAVWNRYDYKELPMALEMLQQERENNIKQQEKKELKSDEYQFLNKEGEAPQYELKNPPEGMRDPTWWDKLKERWDNFQILSPTAVLRNGFTNVDPMVLRNFTGDSSAQYVQNYGQGITNVTYHVKVGDVNVAQTNASPQEIGQSVADRTTNALIDRANYSQINSAVTGMQIV